MGKLFILAALLSSSILTMGQNASIVVEGSKQGFFKNENPNKSSGKGSEILGYSQDVSSPRDAASGMATGKKVFQPIYLLKAAGASSPQFFQAMTTNEMIKKVTISFFKTSSAGLADLDYVVILENASITGYKQFMGPLDNEKFNPPSNTVLYDEIRINFQKITVESKSGQTIATYTN